MKTTPFTCPSNFEPLDSHYLIKDDFGALIPRGFIDGQVQRFIIHFQEKKTRRCGWNRSFKNWILKGWEWRPKENKTNPTAYKETVMDIPVITDRSVGRAALKKLRGR